MEGILEIETLSGFLIHTPLPKLMLFEIAAPKNAQKDFGEKRVTGLNAMCSIMRNYEKSIEFPNPSRPES